MYPVIDEFGGIFSRMRPREKFVRAFAMLLAAGLASSCSPSPHDLIARGDQESLASLLESRPDAVNDRNRLDKTALHYAVSYKREEALDLLVRHGADLHARDVTGMTPLHVAAMLGRRDEALWLLEHGADPEIRDDFGDTPMHTAALFGAGGVIQVLHRSGASLQTKNNDGLRPLALAAKHKQERVVKFLQSLLGAA